MTWHSSARGTPNGRLTQRVDAVAETIVIVPTTPVSKNRLVNLGINDQGEGAIDSLPVGVQARMTNFAAAERLTLRYFVVDSAGVRYPIALNALVNGANARIADPLILKEGERLEVDLSAPVANPNVEVLAQWVDVQGPLVLERVDLTDEYQVIVPSPPAGHAHSMLYRIDDDTGNLPDYSYSLASDGAAAGVADLARFVDGVNILEDVSGAIPIVINQAQGLVSLAEPGIMIALNAGETVQAKLQAAVAGVHFLVIPYLLVPVN